MHILHTLTLIIQNEHTYETLHMHKVDIHKRNDTCTIVKIIGEEGVSGLKQDLHQDMVQKDA